MREVEQHLKVGGRRIFVRDVGDGQPVLLCNGIGAHTEMWRPLEQALEGQRVISFDVPGTGRSASSRHPFTMSSLARLTEQLFDQLSIERGDVIGYSFGGALAQQLAIQSPERVRRLVLVATLPGWGGVPGHLSALLAMMTPLRYHSRRFYELTAAQVAGGRARTDRDYLARLWGHRAGHAPSLLGYTYQLSAMSAWSSLPWLSRIQAPTVVVVGDDDPLVPLGNALMMAHRIPEARVLVGAGEGHFLLLDEDNTVSSSIHDFLAADRYADSAVWRTTDPVDAEQVAAQLRIDGLGALPWGAVSAAVRKVVGALA